jgi:hypothetical protein
MFTATESLKVADDKLARKKVLSQYLLSEGHSEFLKELSDHLTCADSEISEQQRSFISEVGLNKLNFNLGIKSGLNRVLNILNSYKEELED